MLVKKFLASLTARQIIWSLTVLFLALISFFIAQQQLHPAFIIAPLAIIMIAIGDELQTKHTVRKNYPVVGTAICLNLSGRNSGNTFLKVSWMASLLTDVSALLYTKGPKTKSKLSLLVCRTILTG
jgi:hypothetical protein